MVVVVGQDDALVLGGREHCGGVGFEKEAVAGDVAEGFTDFVFALVEEVAAEREVGSKFGEGGDHFGAAGVGVEEEGGEVLLLLENF